MAKKCERCGDVPIYQERFCKACKEIIMGEMKEAGYLQTRPIGHAGGGRTSEMKEKTHETKFGTWHG